MCSIEEIKKHLPKLASHPAADRLPQMAGNELESLKLDMLMNGMLHPIWIMDNQIVDGRARYQVLRWLKQAGELSFVPNIRVWPHPVNDVEALVRSLNIHRRHYTPQQRAVYAARYLVPDLKGEALERMRRRVPSTLFPNLEKGNANAIAARQAGTNEKYVQYAIHIDKVNDQFLDFVMARQMNLQEGMKFIRMKAEKRTYLFDWMKEGKTYKEALRLYQETAMSRNEKESSKKVPLAKAKDSLRGPIVRKVVSESLNNNWSSMDMILPASIQEHVLEEMVAVLHKHGYNETPYRVWLAEDTLAAQKRFVPLFAEGGVTAYEVSPRVSTQMIETTSEETSGEDTGARA